MPTPARYWDACTFLGWLSEEPDKVDECRGVIHQAEAGNVLIVTSSLTLVEVIKLKGEKSLAEEYEPTIREFFKHAWIVVRQLDRFIAEDARQFVWRHGFDPKDSVHVATALRSGVKRLDTFDDELISRSGLVGDLVIGRPHLDEQLAFAPIEEVTRDTEGDGPETPQPHTEGARRAFQSLRS
jgi:predicted nucleic acid-binding protein